MHVHAFVCVIILWLANRAGWDVLSGKDDLLTFTSQVSLHRLIGYRSYECKKIYLHFYNIFTIAYCVPNCNNFLKKKTKNLKTFFSGKLPWFCRIEAPDFWELSPASASISMPTRKWERLPTFRCDNFPRTFGGPSVLAKGLKLTTPSSRIRHFSRAALRRVCVHDVKNSPTHFRY